MSHNDYNNIMQLNLEDFLIRRFYDDFLNTHYKAFIDSLKHVQNGLHVFF